MQGTPGRPPKAAAYAGSRRGSAAPVLRLPASGRSGPVPRWPLGPEIETQARLAELEHLVDEARDQAANAHYARDRVAARKRATRAERQVRGIKLELRAAAELERQIWAELWKRPQAIQWERLRCHRDVAQYARHKAKAEGGSRDDQKEARQLGDRLGLTPVALQRLRWEIVDDPTAVAPSSRARSQNPKYAHLRVVGPRTQ